MSNKTLLILISSFMVLCLASCSREIKVCQGMIKNLNDSVMVTSIGDYDIRFNIKNAEYTNGAIMEGDSVAIHYVGDLKDKKALAVTVKLLPKKGAVVDAVYNPDKELEVSERPMTEKETKDLEDYAKSSRKRR